MRRAARKPRPGHETRVASAFALRYHDAMDLLERERRAIVTHREAMQGSSLPAPLYAPKGTFMHGFLLPFSLIAANVRDPVLRRPYLRLALVRALAVLVVGVIAIATGSISPKKSKHGRRSHFAVVVGDDAKPVHVNIPGLHVDLDDTRKEAEVSVLGQEVPVVRGADTADVATDAKPGVAAVVATMAGRTWAWLLTLLALLSAVEAIVVFFSRRWDDWLSFHGARLAGILPEDAEAGTPEMAFDLKWLFKKLKRRIRGYIVLAAGIPALLPLRLIPMIGPWAFTIALTLWGWYWLGVFSAAKSAHAWADGGTAPAPRPIRALNERVSSGRLVSPLRVYGRIWARLTRDVNPAAATFDRTPAAFLGLALARAVLSLPGLYLLARPVIPVAAGRLCAEGDPASRFSAPPLA